MQPNQNHMQEHSKAQIKDFKTCPEMPMKYWNTTIKKLITPLSYITYEKENDKQTIKSSKYNLTDAN